MIGKKTIIVFIFLLSLLSLTHLLTFAQGAGYIQIKGDPGADVFLDDRAVGKIHPESGNLILKDIPAGAHQLKIEKEGYYSYSEDINLKPNEVYFSEVSLKPKIGILFLVTNPIECIIEIPQLAINQNNKGNKTERYWELPIPIGEYTIFFTASGKSMEYNLKIEEGVRSRLLVNILNNEAEEVKEIQPFITWEKTYCEIGYGFANSIIQTTGGGYAVAGVTSASGAGRYDAWIIKLDSYGDIVWEKTYGGNKYHVASSIIETTDGGYAIAGKIFSEGADNSDVWIIKLDSKGGMVWEKAYGGIEEDYALCIIQTTDGGYAVAGSTSSVNGRDTNIYKKYAWVIKLDSYGDIVWAKAYGGSEYDSASSIIQTADGGYAIAGGISYRGTVYSDFWVIKLDDLGNLNPELGVVHKTKSEAEVTESPPIFQPSLSHSLSLVDLPESIIWEKTYGGIEEDYVSSIIQTTDGGYVVAGRTSSKGSGAYDAWIIKLDSFGSIDWEKVYGESGYDYAISIIQTTDGGYAVAGLTQSKETDYIDGWIIKLDNKGNIDWEKVYGESEEDVAISIIQTTDGGYAVAGYTKSKDAYGNAAWIFKLDNKGNIDWEKIYGGSKSDGASSIIQTTDGGYAVVGYNSSKRAGGYDVWIIKLDSYGDIFWDRTYGGSGHHVASSIIQTIDGGYAVAGGNTPKGADSMDAWIIKLDNVGNIVLDRTYGGSGDDEAYCIIQTTDGGYAVAGRTSSKGAGEYDAWIIKLDNVGNIVLDRTYGGSEIDVASSITQTTDGGYAVAGYTSSKGVGGSDAWIIKLDEQGNIDQDLRDIKTEAGDDAKEIQPIISWEKTYGGPKYDSASSIIQTTDGGYAVAGYTESKGVSGYDAWIIKLDSYGNIVWDKTYGLSNYNEANSIIQTTDGGYAIAGKTSSEGVYGHDAWILKLDSNGDIIWKKIYGGESYYEANSIIQTTDGGYAVAGIKTSEISTHTRFYDYDVWIIKLDSMGNVVWEKTYGGESYDGAYSIIQTTDGGYALAGYTQSKGINGNAALVIKLDSNGNMLWEKSFGENEYNIVYSIIQTTDGGYAVGGGNRSRDNDYGDFWVIKLDSNGNTLWDRTYGDSNNDYADYAYSIIQTTDGGYAVAGMTKSKSYTLNVWIIKTDSQGNIVWEKTFGDIEQEWMFPISIIQTTDGGYAIAGYTSSKGAGSMDAWVIKLDEQGNLNQELKDLPTEIEVSVEPSPLKGSLHCSDKAGYSCPGCLDEPGYVNHFQGFNVLTEEEDCYVSLVTSDGSSMGDVNDCVVTITGEKWLGLEDEEGTLLVGELNRGNFDFEPAHQWSSKTMNFPRDGYQYQLAEGGKEFRLHLSRNLKESFQAVPWQNLSLELKNNKTGNIYTYQFSKGIFPRPYSWGNGVANYGQCVWWAAKRWTEEVGSNLFPFYPQRSNMGKVKSLDNTYTPQQYDVLINYDLDNAHALGHYAFIEKVEDDLTYISQYNFIPPGEVYNVIPRFWSGNPKSLYYSLNPHNEYYFRYYYRD